MNGLHRPSLCLFRVLPIGISGSRSQAIDDTLYRNGSIPVRPASSRGSTGAWMTIHRIKSRIRRECRIVNPPVTINNGKNDLSTQAPPDSGGCKRFRYHIQKGERKTAAIRDIVVEHT
jgi:hypothetical protein